MVFSYRRPRWWSRPALVWLLVLAAIFATEYVVMVLLPWVLPEQHSRVVEAAIDAVSLTAVVAPLIWFTVVRPLREVNQLRSQFLSQLFSSIEADRREVALELHDGIGQSMSVLVAGLRSLRGDPAASGDRLLVVAQETLQDVKRLARGLRPSLLDDLGLAPALERLVDDVQIGHSLTVALDIAELADVRLPEAVETAAFRIIQEALANVAVHSGATQAHIRVQRLPDRLRITVADAGRGMAGRPSGSAQAGHLGLNGMRERALLLGGTFDLATAPGQGVTITAEIPLDA